MPANQPQPGPNRTGDNSRFRMGPIVGTWSPVAPAIALITQRSLVQIQPPQPSKSMGYGTHTVARWFFSPTFGPKSSLKHWSSADGPSGRLRTVRCGPRGATRAATYLASAGRESIYGAARRAGWTCDSSRRICGANLQCSPLRAHRAEHDLGYLPRALSNPLRPDSRNPEDPRPRACYGPLKAKTRVRIPLEPPPAILRIGEFILQRPRRGVPRGNRREVPPVMVIPASNRPPRKAPRR